MSSRDVLLADPAAGADCTQEDCTQPRPDDAHQEAGAAAEAPGGATWRDHQAKEGEKGEEAQEGEEGEEEAQEGEKGRQVETSQQQPGFIWNR